jgi:hypothetical protein
MRRGRARGRGEVRDMPEFYTARRDDDALAGNLAADMAYFRDVADGRSYKTDSLVNYVRSR